MLAELTIDDLVLIAHARLRLSPGLNVITGETGAGKTLLAQAIGLLMGQRPDPELVRAGAERALVQAVFEGTHDMLSVAREVPRGGRSRAYLDGLVTSAATVEQKLRERVAFYGQLEHARLLHLERQVDLLDAYASQSVAPLLEEYQAALSHARAVEQRLHALLEHVDDRERERALLSFQVQEIEAAGLEPGEDERIENERVRLRHAEKLLERIGGAVTLLSGETEVSGIDHVRGVSRLVDEAAALDSSLAGLSERLHAAAAELEDVGYALQAYLDGLEADPEHRDAVERRYDVLQDLKRKYGRSATDVLAFLDKASQRLTELQEDQADATALEAEVQSARAAAVAAGARLSAAREQAAAPFAQAVTAELRSLAMPHARFEVRLSARGDDWAALARQGAEDVELLFCANPGMPLRPLRETASGGELSRAMLAIRGIVSAAGDVETLIFDEVDTGIGGMTATGLGERLARLAASTQIVCITHLPQVVAFADRHFAIVKHADPQRGHTETQVTEVEGDGRVAELCRMLGSTPQDEAARSHAQGLLERARLARRS